MPGLPIPYTMHLLTQEIIRRKGDDVEGVFRLPGDLKLVNTIAGQMNMGKKPDFNSMTLNDVCSLLKKWVGKLSEPMFPIDQLGPLQNVYKSGTGEYLPLLSAIPRANKVTLMYLIGFLQVIARKKEINKMDANNLAICFSPNIVKAIGYKDPTQAANFMKIGIEFVRTLIEKWDTSRIYPLPSQFLPM